MTERARRAADYMHNAGLTRPEVVAAAAADLIRQGSLTPDEAPSFAAVAIFGQS